MNDYPAWINAVVAALTGAAASYFGLRRRYSRDSVAITRDKTETTFIVTLMAERDSAMKSAKEAWEKRTEDARAIARFEALDEAREREVNRLREEIFALRLHTRKLTAIIVRLDPQAAALLQLGDGDGDGISDNKEER